MSSRQLHIWGLIIAIIIIIAFSLLIYNVRTEQISAASYKNEVSLYWNKAIRGYEQFTDTVLSLKPDQSSLAEVRSEASSKLQNLDSINIPQNVPQKYQTFSFAFADAITSNKQYYRKILQLCNEKPESRASLIPSLFTLGQVVEDKYHAAHQLMPSLGEEIGPGRSTEANEHLSAMTQFKHTVPPSTPPPRRIVVNRNQYSPPHTGNIVTVDTPEHNGLNLRLEPSKYAERIPERELLPQGEVLFVLDRDGDWVRVKTEDGFVGFVRWLKDDLTYISPTERKFVSSRPTRIYLKIISVTSPISPGENATLVAQTVGGAYCTITVYYLSGPSRAAGLYSKYADNHGSVSWTWRVGTRTTSGTWPIVVTATKNGQTAKKKTSFEVL